MRKRSFFSSNVNIVCLILSILILLILQYQLWYGETGIVEHRQLKQAIIKQQEMNQEAIARNNLLMAEVRDLKKGLDVVEEYARLDLGLIKSNETFVQINAASKTELPQEFTEQGAAIAPAVEEVLPEVKN